MEDMEKKIKVSSKVVAVFMRVGYVSMIVAFCILLCGVVFNLFVPSGVWQVSEKFAVKSSLVGIELHTVQELLTYLVCTTAIFAFLYAIFYRVYRVFHSISETGVPFTAENGKNMRGTAVLILVMTVVSWVLDGCINMLAPAASKAAIRFDFTGILVGVICYCFALIFDYGCQLQQLSDETL